MNRHLTILTGASRGMGLAMAEQLLDAGHDLLCISRKHNDALGLRCEQWPQDLARPDVAASNPVADVRDRVALAAPTESG